MSLPSQEKDAPWSKLRGLRVGEQGGYPERAETLLKGRHASDSFSPVSQSCFSWGRCQGCQELPRTCFCDVGKNCVYVCVCSCICACMCVRMCIGMYVRACVCMCARVCAYVCVCACICVCAYVCACMCVCVHMGACMCMRVCMCVHAYVWVWAGVCAC